MDSKPIFEYFKNLNSTQIEQFEALGELYRYWNNQINVVSRKDIDQLYINHVLHSLAIHFYRDLSSENRLVDIGTGGGFPAIPLAILYPETEIFAVDSIAKKIKVVREVSNSLGLKNVVPTNERVENLKIKSRFFVTRAVAKSETLWNWVSPKLIKDAKNASNTGIICLKGGDLDEELAALKVPFIEKKLSKFFKEDFFETKKIIHIYPIY